MKLTALAALILVAAACSPQVRVDRASAECATLGYAAGTSEYAGCVERGYRAAKQGDSSTASTLTSLLMVLAVL
ncbi:hypothetical protein [Leisingera sp. ANG-M7]|uniref:hypothetical protein n=1 Tax=Leisingera sp. ANG-M7 TaxID=1577902 RepID=UPI00057E6572|nr:hypothetical protein [Leisingera sp. ANG-M7]KIC39383.1 hypothetical protein RA26_01665 [Leisingera sp. ANG-M7]